MSIEDLTYDLFQLDNDRVRVVISLYGKELGTIYLEKAKRAFTNKPVSMHCWCVVDCKIDGLYDVGGEDITPKNIVDYCQKLIKSKIK